MYTGPGPTKRTNKRYKTKPKKNKKKVTFQHTKKKNMALNEELQGSENKPVKEDKETSTSETGKNIAKKTKN